MFRAAVRAIVTASLAALILPVTVAAAPNPQPRLSEVLAEPSGGSYTEVQQRSPGLLEGDFNANDYAAIGGLNSGATIKILHDDGFIAGYGRAWTQQAPNRVLVEIVVAFTGGSGAKTWLQQSQQADLADPTFQHSITVDGIGNYYGARMSDSTSYFADAFLFVKGNDGFLVSTISNADDLGDSAAVQTRIQYHHAPAYTIPPDGWPGNRPPLLSLANAIDYAPRITAGLAATATLIWLAIFTARRRRRRRGYLASGL